jgi:hypothetical protein
MWHRVDAMLQTVLTGESRCITIKFNEMRSRRTSGELFPGRNKMAIDLLERAFNEAAKLPEAEQRELAVWILDELASERRWAELLQDSQDVLGQLADEALADLDAGQTEPLDPERL